MDAGDRVRRLVDRIEIGELVSRYTIAVDDRDYNTIVSYFTSDGVLSRPPWQASGSAELIRAYRAALGRYEWTFHSVHAQAVDFADEDTASGFVTCHAEHALDGQVVLAALRYRDRYRRESSRWRFAAREIGFTYVYPVPGSDVVAYRDTSVRWPGETISAYSVR